MHKEKKSEIETENNTNGIQNTAHKDTSHPLALSNDPRNRILRPNEATKQEAAMVQAEVVKYIKEKLTMPDSQGNVFYKKFIDSFLRDALEDPSGRCGQTLASGLFTAETIRTLDKEAQDQINKNRDFAIYRIRSTLFKEQQDVFDNDIDRKIIVICSRRAGKTELNARKILKTILKDNSPVLYLNKTFANAIQQMFDLILELAGQLEIPIKASKKTDGFIEFTNGSRIQFGGINDIAAIDKYRGYKYRLAIVDEVGHIKNANYLIDEVLTPATSDFSDSQMIFTGTPPRIKNYATILWHSNIRKYHWTAEVNPFIPDFRAFITRICEEKGLLESDPFIQREYFGNMDAYDTESLIFKGYKKYKTIDSTFRAEWAYIGIDWGFYDHFAIVSFLYDPIRSKAYVYDVYAGGKIGVDEKKAIINKKYLEAGDRLREYGYDLSRVRLVCDTNQPDTAFDLYRQGLPIEKAYKVDLMGSTEELAGKLRTGRIMIPEDWTEETNELIQDLERTVYRRDDETDLLLPEIDDDSYHPNAVHALRYAVRNAFDGQSGGPVSNVEEIDSTKGPLAELFVEKNSDLVEQFVI